MLKNLIPTVVVALFTIGSGSGQSAEISGELKTWHKVTLTMDGYLARETDRSPNPFTDYRLTVKFTHQSGLSREVPGYFAADGDAAETGASEGTKWRAHLSPDKPGKWTYHARFDAGRNVAVGGKDFKTIRVENGSFVVSPSDKKGRDFRAHGRLEYVGKNHLQFAGSKQWFLKAGADSPETLLAYADFDGAKSRRPLKTWKPHLRDWKKGDPSWKNGKGKGLIGALNYLSEKGANAFSFLPYNAGGDGDNVWPFRVREDKFHYDCSKLDQWGIVFDHGTNRGLYLHFKLQETENDDNNKKGTKDVPASLDGGDLGPERKLYLREMIARFGHALALNWNLGKKTPRPRRSKLRWQSIFAKPIPTTITSYSILIPICRTKSTTL